VKLHLPKFKKCKVDFLVQILCDEKDVFEKQELKHSEITQYWSEFAVKNVWPQIKENDEVRRYLPDGLD
jgi:hypothetical protein